LCALLEKKEAVTVKINGAKRKTRGKAKAKKPTKATSKIEPFHCID